MKDEDEELVATILGVNVVMELNVSADVDCTLVDVVNVDRAKVVVDAEAAECKTDGEKDRGEDLSPVEPLGVGR